MSIWRLSLPFKMMMRMQMCQSANAYHSLGKVEKEKFDAVFPQILDDITSADVIHGADARKWFRKVNEYTVPVSSNTYGRSLAVSYNILRQGQATGDELLQARRLGWCYEWSIAAAKVSDDFQDKAKERYGKPCWHLLPEVGRNAINDVCYLQLVPYMILTKYFKHMPCYTLLVEIIEKSAMDYVIAFVNKASTGSHADNPDWANYVIDKYDIVLQHAFYAFGLYVAVACALHLAGTYDENSSNMDMPIFVHLSQYGRIQNDYNDVYGDPELLGKDGTDIECDVCTWLLAQALINANEQQVKILKDNYGQSDPSKVRIVKQLYNDMELDKAFLAYEEESYKKLVDMVESSQSSTPKEVFYFIANTFYRQVLQC